MGYVYLSIAIVAEVIATSALKESLGFSKLGPSLVSVIGYMVAFYLLALTLQTISVGIAYAIWAGVGIVLIAAVGVLLFKQTLDPPAFVGMAFIVLGILIINVFSSSVGA